MNDNQKIVLVTFEIGEECFAVSIHQMKEVIRVPEVINIPNAPECVKGIINLRGEVVSLIDMHKRFNLDKRHAVHDKKSRVIIIEVWDRLIGLLVDRVIEVLHLSFDDIEEVPPEAMNQYSRYMKGIGKKDNRFIMIIDVIRLFDPKELSSMQSQIG